MDATGAARTCLRRDILPAGDSPLMALRCPIHWNPNTAGPQTSSSSAQRSPLFKYFNCTLNEPLRAISSSKRVAVWLSVNKVTPLVPREATARLRHDLARGSCCRWKARAEDNSSRLAASSQNSCQQPVLGGDDQRLHVLLAASTSGAETAVCTAGQALGSNKDVKLID